MRRWLIRHWVSGLISLTIFIGIAGNVILLQEIGTPFAGFISSRNFYEPNIGYIDLETTPTWWPGLPLIAPITAINGKPYSSNVRHEFAASYEQADKTATLTLLSDNGEVDFPVTVYRFTMAHYFDLKAIELVTAAAFWLLAIMVYRANPTGIVNRVFAIACSLVALHRMLTVTTLFLDDRFVPHFWELVILITAAFLGAAFFHFACLFPQRMQTVNRILPPVFYGLAIMFTLFFLYARLTWLLNLTPLLASYLENWAFWGTLVMFGISVLFLLGRLTTLLLQQSRTQREQRILLIICSGVLLSLPVIVMVLLPVLPISHNAFHSFWQGFDLRPLLLAIPLAFAYVILRYQALQSRHVLFTVVIVLASAALLANLGVGVWLHMNPQVAASGRASPMLFVLGVSLASGALWAGQETRQAIFGRVFMWDERSYTAVNQFGQQVLQETNIDILPQTIADALVEKLDLEQAVVWLWQADNSRLQLHGQAGLLPTSLPQTLQLDKSFFDTHTQPLYLRHPTLTKLPAVLQTVSLENGFEVLVALTLNIEPVGLLALGKRWDEEIFDARDLEIVTLIAQQATLFLVAARQMAELRQVPQRMAAVQEQERLRIAQELHDTIQQFLGRLPFFLELSRDAVQDEPDEADKLLERSIADVEQAARTVRQIRNNLAPSQLSGGITRPLQDLISRFTQRTAIDTQINIEREIDQQLPLTGRHALYRVMQQALDNIEGHAEATAVAVEIHLETNKVVFVINDNGRGFSESERQRAQAQGSFGLQSMQARIEGAGGQLQITSTYTDGTKLVGWLPLIAPE